MKITNLQFVRALAAPLLESGLFESDVLRLIGCSFAGDPNNPPEYAWKAVPINPTAAHEPLPSPSKNNYVAICAFRLHESGRWRRKQEAFVCLLAVMVDDVGTKVPRSAIKLPFSCEIETSPGNTQGWYFIGGSATCEELDRDICARLIQQMIGKGLALKLDPGMNGVNRVGRLPIGLNGKAKYGPQGFTVRCRHWHPERRYTVRQIAGAYDLDLTRAKRPLLRSGAAVAGERFTAAAGAEFDQLMANLGLLGLIQGEPREGWTPILCPWFEEHSDRAESGAAVGAPTSEYPTGRYKCHHGHCEGRSVGVLRAKVLEMLEEELQK